MNGVPVAVHQSSRRSGRRKLVSMTRSPSVAVVSEIAPMWKMAWSSRPASQADRSAGGTKSASRRFCRLRHLPSEPRWSHTATSPCPASLSRATRLDPMKPAPPVTKNMPCPETVRAAAALLCPSPGAIATRKAVSTPPRRRVYKGRGASAGRRVNSLKTNGNLIDEGKAPATGASPILIVPYMWIGDFVRCHSVVRLLKARFPDRPVDVLTTAMVAPLLDYMPGVRKGIVFDLPRKRLALSSHRALADRLRTEGYGDALIMPRTWKSALAPALAGIPVRTGFVGEMRFGLVNDLRPGEKALPRMVDRCAALALPKHAALPADWPHPQLVVPREEVSRWRERTGLTDTRPVAVVAPGAVGPSKRWPAAAYAE